MMEVFHCTTPERAEQILADGFLRAKGSSQMFMHPLIYVSLTDTKFYGDNLEAITNQFDELPAKLVVLSLYIPDNAILCPEYPSVEGHPWMWFLGQFLPFSSGLITKTLYLKPGVAEYE